MRHVATIGASRFLIFGAIMCFGARPWAASAAPGDLDATFGTGGIVVTAVDGLADLGGRPILQPDGKILQVGTVITPGGGHFAALRYDATGTLDPAFGTGGVARVQVSTGAANALAGAHQSDGKVVVAGAGSNGSNMDFAVARFNADGTVDLGFGPSGVVTTAIGSSNDNGLNVAVQADGKIVVVGESRNGSGDYDVAIVRYDATGAPDATFGTGGIVTTSISAFDDRANGVALQPDGKIVIVGQTENGSDTDGLLIRYDSGGALDGSFGTGGIVTTTIGGGNDSWLGMALLGGGEILASGQSFNGSVQVPTLARFTAAGALDAGFGTAGVFTTAIGSGDAFAGDLSVQSNGRIVAAATASNGANNDFALLTLLANGSLDGGFGTGGTVQTDLGSSVNDTGFGLAIQADGRLVVSGFTQPGGVFAFAIARYEGETPVCGNGAVDFGEDCDDGNVASGDCCSSICAFETAGSSCVDDGEACTTDLCDGAGICVHAAGNPGAVCRPGSGDLCDPDETCTGIDPTCPTDVVASAGTLCDSGSGDICDPDEVCSGSPGAACPGDVIAALGTVCRAGSGDACDPDEVCSGVAGVACPADVVASAGTVCNPGSGDVCDPAEVCSGTPGVACPPDSVSPAGTVCNAGSGDVCDPAETCTGSPDTPCPADVFEPSSTVCRAAVGECDVDESCPGSADGSCPAQAIAPDGTACSDGDGECDDGTCIVSTSGLESFTCWKVKDTRNPRFEPVFVDLDDAFATQEVELKKPFMMCAPASVDGSTVENTTDHICCYKAKGAKLDPPRPVVSVDGVSLGQVIELEVKKTALFCEPCTSAAVP